MNVAKVAFSYITSMNTERYLSTIGVCDGVNESPLSSLMLLLNGGEIL